MTNFRQEINYQLSNPFPLCARKVKILFAKRGKRSADLVAQTGISPSYVSKHVNGKARNPIVQRAIADFLQVPLEAILDKSPKAKVRTKADFLAAAHPQENSL